MSAACHIAITSCLDAYGCVFWRFREDKLQKCGISVFFSVYLSVCQSETRKRLNQFHDILC